MAKLAVNRCSSSAVRLESGQQYSSSQTCLSSACRLWFPGNSRTQFYPTDISDFSRPAMIGKERDGQCYYVAIGSNDDRRCLFSKNLSTELLAGAAQKSGRILDRDPRRYLSPSFCLKDQAASRTSELPLTAVCVICSLKSQMLEMWQSP